MIKRTFTLLILIISLFAAKTNTAQGYTPMAVENAQWIITEHDIFNPNPYPPFENIYEYLSNGDTLVNNHVYTKIYKRFLDPAIYYPPFVPIGEYVLHGLIRDDIENKKVYAILLHETNQECPINEEYLLYDFDVSVGDTLYTCQMLFGDFIVSGIWENAFIYGFFTNVYWDGRFSADIYEGIGMNSGLFEDIDVFFAKENSAYLVALRNNYCREIPCGLIVDSKENNSNNFNNFIIHQNKSELILSIQSGSKANRFLLFNYAGQIVEEVVLISYQAQTYRINAPRGGFYIGVLHSDQTVLETQKVIITNNQ